MFGFFGISVSSKSRIIGAPIIQQQINPLHQQGHHHKCGFNPLDGGIVPKIENTWQPVRRREASCWSVLAS